MDTWKEKPHFYQDEETILEDFTKEYAEDDFDEMIGREDKLVKKLDDELLEYFSEARIISKKPSSKQKKKKEKVIYVVNQQVKASGRKGTVIYGPYEKDGKIMYEIEIVGNGVISVEEKHIEKV